MLDESILSIKGIGEKKGKILKDESSIETIEDLLYYIPRKYLDRSSFKSIRDCFVNESVTVSGTIEDVSISGNRRKFLQVMINDGTDSLLGIFFGGINFFHKIFQPGDSVIFSGKIQFFKARQIIHPDFDFIDDGPGIGHVNTGRIVPLYRSSEKLKSAGFDSRGFRKIIKQAIEKHLSSVSEPLADGILSRRGLPGLRETLVAVHFPESFQQAEDARKRLAFNEIFFLQYYLHLSRKYVREKYSRLEPVGNSEILKEFIGSLPFPLTGDQLKAIEEIRVDMEAGYPMNRLLQGDVGSGKTVVAMAAAIITVSQGFQAAVMAPTELLASQHYANFQKFIPPGITVTLLTGSLPRKAKEKINGDLKGGTINILIGTHALIQESVEFRKVGLIVIDEQHRFGVEQRSRLRGKGEDADLLVMTATPIPRSLTMTLYGDLDVSYLKEKPAMKVPVKTMSFPVSRIRSVFNSLEKYMALGRQIYYVLPVIEETEKSDLRSAVEACENLKDTVFPHRRIELLHGRMKQEVKDEVMGRFRAGEIDILVSTTVIEVGIDVPNANVIVIEHSERFGLSQLHQLRGRVGRGSHESFCVLLYPDDAGIESMKRIETIASTDDGFAISEEDLSLRGPGEFTGIRQHGHAGSFEFLDLVRDFELIGEARREAIDYAEKELEAGDECNGFEGGLRVPAMKNIRTKRILSLLS